MLQVVVTDFLSRRAEAWRRCLWQQNYFTLIDFIRLQCWQRLVNLTACYSSNQKSPCLGLLPMPLERSPITTQDVSSKDLEVTTKSLLHTLQFDPSVLVPDISGVLNTVHLLKSQLEKLKSAQLDLLTTSDMDSLYDEFDLRGMTKEEVEAMNSIAPVGQRLEDVMTDEELSMKQNTRRLASRTRKRLGRSRPAVEGGGTRSREKTNVEEDLKHKAPAKDGESDKRTKRGKRMPLHGENNQSNKNGEAPATTGIESAKNNNRKRKRGLDAEIASLQTSTVKPSQDFQQPMK